MRYCLMSIVFAFLGEPVPPIGRRLVVLGCGALIWVVSLVFAEHRSDWRIAALGTGLWGCVLLLWALTPYRWTWGWWL